MIDPMADQYFKFPTIRFERADFVGYVYVIFSRRLKLFKIGHSKNDPAKRMRDMQTGNPDCLRVIFSIQAKYPENLERELHAQFDKARVNGEWFSLDDNDLMLIQFQRIDMGYRENDDLLPYFYNDGMEKGERYYPLFTDCLFQTDDDIMLAQEYIKQ